jgi:hypothetical protein
MTNRSSQLSRSRRRFYARLAGAGALACLTAVTAAGGVASGAAGRTAGLRPVAGGHFASPVAEAAVNGSVFVVNEAGGGSVTQLKVNPTGAQATVERVLHGPNYGFSTPDAATVDGNDLYVVDRGAANGAGAGAGVSDLSVRTGNHVRVVRGPAYKFSSPDAVVADGAYLLVLNAGGSITEITTLGKLVRVIAGSKYGFDDPVAAVMAKGGLWVVNAKNNSLTEVNPANGNLVNRVATTPTNGLVTPDGITFDGTNLWVANSGNNTLSEFNGVSGKFVANRTNNLGYGMTNPGPMTFGGTYVYVVSPPGSSPMVTGIVPSTAALHFWMCNTNYPFHFTNPQAIIAAGGYLFVANQGSSTVTQMNAISGVLVGSGPIS